MLGLNSYTPTARHLLLKENVDQCTQALAQGHTVESYFAKLKENNLSTHSVIIFKVINFVIKCFNWNYTTIDKLLAQREAADFLVKYHNKITKLSPGISSPKNCPFVIVGDQIDQVATKYRFKSLKAGMYVEDLKKFRGIPESTEKASFIAVLPAKLKKMLQNIVEIYGGGAEEARQVNGDLQLLLKKLSQTANAEGKNLLEQLEALMESKRIICDDLATLHSIDFKLRGNSSPEEIKKELEKLSDKELFSSLIPTQDLREEIILEQITSLVTSTKVISLIKKLNEESLAPLNKIFKNFLNKVSEEISIYNVSADRLAQKFPEGVLETPIHTTFVAAEWVGFANEGGLGEAVKGMALGIKKQHPENKVRLIFPKYSHLPEELFQGVQPIGYTDSHGKPFQVYKREVDDIECLFIDDQTCHAATGLPPFKIRGQKPSIYGQDDEDTKIRFAAFSGFAADLIRKLDDTDIIHLHDWHVAGVGLKLKKDNLESWNNQQIPPIVFTYHNNGRSFQGRYNGGCYNYAPIIQGLIESGLVPHDGTNPFVEIIRNVADAVTTVSETFGLETQDPDQGAGISFALKEAAISGKLTGVINGNDVSKWNPKTDETLLKWKDPQTGKVVDLSYGEDSEDLILKKDLSKQQLQKWIKKEFSTVEFDSSKPLVTFIGRFDAGQKGLDKFDEAISATLKNGGQPIIMGVEYAGNTAAKKILDELEEKYKNKVLFIRDYKDADGKWHYQNDHTRDLVDSEGRKVIGSDGKVEKETIRAGIGSVVRAASDFTLVPSSYEPCGLTQMEGWMFGSLSIGSKVGGLKDTIITEENNADRFNGYLFDREGTGEASLTGVIDRALTKWKAMSIPDRQSLSRRVMKDGKLYSWTSVKPGTKFTPVEQYRLVYENAKRFAQARNIDKSSCVHLDAPLRRVKESALSKIKPSIDVELNRIEEEYNAAYYQSELSSEELEKLYMALPEELRRQVPPPCGKNVEFQGYKKYGAHLKSDGTTVSFNVLAPAANTVSVRIKGANNVERIEPLTKGEGGVWQCEISNLGPGTHYRYLINGQDKIDPYGFSQYSAVKFEKGGEKGDVSYYPYSVITNENYTWNDQAWMQRRADLAGKPQPMSTYEVHPTIWKRPDGQCMKYSELADALVAHCKKLNFTHVELMGILEHPYEGSEGYQVTGFFAPNSRMGTPEDFKKLVDKLHENEIGIVLDWVPAHFADDKYSLADFDGTGQFTVSWRDLVFSPWKMFIHLIQQLWYQGIRQNWGTYFFDFGKKPVREFMISSAAYWLKEMHIDCLRVDAVNPILWSTNYEEARLFLKDLNAIVHHECPPGAITIAEESSGNFTELGLAPYLDGLGFDGKWNMSMNSGLLPYLSKSPKERESSYQDLVKAIENDHFHRMWNTISHDEVKRYKSLLEMTSGLDGKTKEGELNQFSNLRNFHALLTCLPGKKLFFMGSEFGSTKRWKGGKEDQPLVPRAENNALVRDRPEGLMDGEENGEMQQKTMDSLGALNALYTENPAFWTKDDNCLDLTWIDTYKNDERTEIGPHDKKGLVHAYRRTAKPKKYPDVAPESPNDPSFACLHNFSDKDAEFEVILPESIVMEREVQSHGTNRILTKELYNQVMITEAYNSDNALFGGKGRLNPAAINAVKGANGRWSYKVTVPALSTVIIKEDLTVRTAQ